MVFQALRRMILESRQDIDISVIDTFQTLLLANKTACNQKDDSGMTLLMLAAQRNALPLAEILLIAGADPNLTTQDRHAGALHYGSPNPAIISMLLAHGAVIENDFPFYKMLCCITLAKISNNRIFALFEKQRPHLIQYLPASLPTDFTDEKTISLFETLFSEILFLNNRYETNPFIQKLFNSTDSASIITNFLIITNIGLSSGKIALEAAVEKLFYQKIFTARLPIHEGDPESLFQKHFSTFPREEIWRLFYDVTLQKNTNNFGWGNQEKVEPGYLEGLARAFVYLKNTISQTLSLSLLKALYKEVTSTLSTLNKSGRLYALRRHNSVVFNLTLNYNCSLDGIFELMQLPDYRKAFEIQSAPEDKANPNNFSEFMAEPTVLHASADYNVENFVKKAIYHYHRKISLAVSNNEKLIEISNLIHTLINIHPFPDANCRTICVLLLTRELVRNGFSPAILDNPNILAGYNSDERLAGIYKGIQNFEACGRSEHQTDLFGRSTLSFIEAFIDNTDTDAYLAIWERIYRLLTTHNIGMPGIFNQQSFQFQAFYSNSHRPTQRIIQLLVDSAISSKSARIEFAELLTKKGLHARNESFLSLLIRFSAKYDVSILNKWMLLLKENASIRFATMQALNIKDRYKNTALKNLLSCANDQFLILCDVAAQDKQVCARLIEGLAQVFQFKYTAIHFLNRKSLLRLIKLPHEKNEIRFVFSKALLIKRDNGNCGMTDIVFSNNEYFWHIWYVFALKSTALIRAMLAALNYQTNGITHWETLKNRYPHRYKPLKRLEHLQFYINEQRVSAFQETKIKINLPLKLLRAIQHTTNYLPLPSVNRGYPVLIFNAFHSGMLAHYYDWIASDKPLTLEIVADFILKAVKNNAARLLLRDTISKEILANAMGSYIRFAFAHVMPNTLSSTPPNLNQSHLDVQVALLAALHYRSSGYCTEQSALIFYRLFHTGLLSATRLFLEHPTLAPQGHSIVITGPFQKNCTLRELAQSPGDVIDLWRGLVYPRSALCTDEMHLQIYADHIPVSFAHNLGGISLADMLATQPTNFDLIIKELLDKCIDMIEQTKLEHDHAALTEDKLRALLSKTEIYCTLSDMEDNQRKDNLKNTERTLAARAIFHFWKERKIEKSAGVLDQYNERVKQG